jgi:hypothetical protein
LTARESVQSGNLWPTESWSEVISFEMHLQLCIKGSVRQHSYWNLRIYFLAKDDRQFRVSLIRAKKCGAAEHATAELLSFRTVVVYLFMMSEGPKAFILGLLKTVALSSLWIRFGFTFPFTAAVAKFLYLSRDAPQSSDPWTRAFYIQNISISPKTCFSALK